MDIGIGTIALAVGAGLASVLSPCVLPVVPVIVAGSARDDRLRPLLVVIGLSITFMAMGVVSAMLGHLLVGRMRSIEIAGGVVILVLGVLTILDINLFKRLYVLQNIQAGGEGRIGTLLLGMALGVIWVPCVGPMLSAILTAVGTKGEIGTGIVLLGFYSLGLAIPMLALGYSSHLVKARLRAISGDGTMVRYVMGGVLVAFGLYIIIKGNFAYS